MSWSARQKKFAQGAQITGIHYAIDQLIAGNYLMLRGKPMHPSVLLNWSITQLRSACSRGFIHEAKLNPAFSPVPPPALLSPPVNDPEFEEVL